MLLFCCKVELGIFPKEAADWLGEKGAMVIGKDDGVPEKEQGVEFGI
jgi:hypothetical protein